MFRTSTILKLLAVLLICLSVSACFRGKKCPFSGAEGEKKHCCAEKHADCGSECGKSDCKDAECKGKCDKADCKAKDASGKSACGEHKSGSCS